MKRFIVLMAFAVLCLASCKDKQESYYLFQGGEMGTLANGIFTTDGGVKMSIIEAPDGADIVTRRRVMLFFTLETDGQQMLVYEIKVSQIVEPDILVPTASDEDDPSPTGDPMNILASWFGGGYINLYTYYFVDSSKETEQAFSSSYKIKGEIATINVSRDGQGEGYFVEAPVERHSYICIPMQPVWAAYIEKNGGEIITDEAGSRTMDVSLNWLWYKSSGTDYLNETIAMNAKGTYYPDTD